MREEYFLGQDGACHWYVVPVAHRADWDEWCNLSEDDERAWDPVLREYSFGQRRGPSSPFVVPGQVPSVATYMLWQSQLDARWANLASLPAKRAPVNNCLASTATPLGDSRAARHQAPEVRPPCLSLAAVCSTPDTDQESRVSPVMVAHRCSNLHTLDRPEGCFVRSGR